MKPISPRGPRQFLSFAFPSPSASSAARVLPFAAPFAASALLLLAAAALPAAPTGKLYWDPAHTSGTAAGGSGTWDATTANWWTGAAPYTWVSGTAGSVATYTDLYFGGAAGGAPYLLSLALDSIQAPSLVSTDLYYFKFNFSGDYIIQSSHGAGTILGITGGKYAYVTMLAAPGRAVTFDGAGGGITVTGDGNNSTNPSVKFAGGGTFNFQGNVTLSNTDKNGRVSFGDPADAGMTHINFLGPLANVSASRVWADNAAVNVNGAFLAIDKNGTNTDAAGIRSALHIGGLAAAGGTPAVFNLNSGTVRAIGTTGTARGVMFGYAANSPGGTFNLNGGVLATTSVQVSPNANASTTAVFVFNGGTLAALAEDITDGAAMYDNQYHLGGFISNFANTGRNRVVIAAGGAFIDTGALDGRTATISSVIRGAGNLTKLGANTLRFAVASTHTGTTIVRGGTLAAGVDNAFAASAALDIGAGGVFDAGATTQTVRNLSGAGTLAIGASGKVVALNGATAGAGTIAGGGAGGGGADSVFAGVIAGAGAFEKAGAGVLTLDGDNSAIAAAITISEGALLLGANGKLGGTVNVGAGMTFGGRGAAGNATAVTLASGAHLRVGSFGATTDEVLSLGSLNLAAGAVVDFTVVPGNINTRINLAAAPVLSGGARASDIALNFERLVSGTYTLGNITALDGASVQINGGAAGPRQMATVRVDGSNLVLDAAVSAAARITWTGAGGAGGGADAATAWNRTGTNWKTTGDGAPFTFADGDSMTFDSVSDAAAGTAARDIAIAGAYVRVADMTVTGTGNYSFSGAALTGEANPDLAGTQGRLLMQGTGTLTLANSGVNEFAGGIELQSGAIRAASAGALGANNINVTGNAALIFDAAAPAPVTSGAAPGAAALDIAALDIAGAISIASEKTLVLDAAATTAATLSGGVAGGALVKTGAGLVTLAAANTHASTTLAGGTLAIAHADALGAGTVAAAAPASPAGAGALASPAGALASSAGAPVLQIGLANLTVNNALDLGAGSIAIDTLANDVTWAGAITGGGTLGKLGSGILYINGAVLATAAGLDIGEGVIRLVPPLAGSYNIYNIVNKLTGAGTLDVRLSGVSDTLALDAGAASGFAGTLGVRDASFTLDAAAAAQLAGATLVVGGNSVISKGAGAMSMRGLHLDGGLFKLAATADAVDGVLTVDTLHAGAAGVTTDIMVDPAILAVSGTMPNPAPAPGNLFDQDTASGGIKAVAAAAVAGAGALRLVDLSGDTITGSATAAITQDGVTVADGVYGFMAGVQPDGLYVGAGLKSIDVHAGRQLVLDPDQAADRNLSAAITGDGGVVIQTAGTAVIAGANTYTGATQIASGIACAGAGDIFKNSASVEIDADAVFDLGGFVQNIKQLAGSGKVDLANGELVLNTAANTALAVALTGTGTLTKNGAGTLSLSAADARGALSITNVNAGRLVARGAQSLGTGGTIAVASGAALEFNGITGLTASLAIAASAATVDVVNSSLQFRNSATRIRDLNLVNSTVTAMGSVHALGSTGVNVDVGANSTLSVTSNPGTTLSMNAGNVTVENTGRLLFGAFGSINRLNLGASGVLTLKDGSAVGFAGVVADGVYEVLSAGTTVFESELGAVNVYAGANKGVSLIITEDGDLAIARLTADPRKDIAMTFDAMTAAMNTIYGRISENFLLPFSEADRNTRRDSFWMKGIATFADYDDTTEQYGHSEDTYGFIVGYDMLTRDRRRMAGLYGGFASSKLDSEGAQSRADADQQFLGVYGAAKWGKFYAGADIAAGWSQSDNTRALATGAGDPGTAGGAASGAAGGGGAASGGSGGAATNGAVTGAATTNGASDAMWYGASVEAGWQLAPAKNFTLRPSLGLHYMNVAFAAYREYGTSAVQYPDITQDLLQSLVALQGSWKFTTPWGWPALFDLRYGWRQNIAETDDEITVFFVGRPDLPMTVHSGGYSRGGQMVGLGLRAAAGRMTTLGLGYDYETAAGRSRHTLTGNVRLSW